MAGIFKHTLRQRLGITDNYYLDTDVHYIKCVSCKCEFQKDMLILHEQQCGQVFGKSSRFWRHNQVEDMILKLCKEVGHQAESQAVYGHGSIPNSNPKDSDEDNVNANRSKGGNNDDTDSEKDVSSVVNSA